MNAVKSGNIAMGSPAGAAATVFPEMGVFLVPYLVKDYAWPTPCSTARSATRLDKDCRTSTSSRYSASSRLRFPPFLDNKKTDHRAEGPARRKDPRAASQSVLGHH